MTFTDWMKETRERFSEDPTRKALYDSLYEFYIGGWRRLGNFVDYGVHPYDREWDVLVLLDACRWDLMAEVSEEYGFLSDEWEYSVASSSPEFMEKVFEAGPRHETERTVYVSGNPFTGENVEPEWFRVLDEVWRYAWDDGIGTIPPQPLTDRAIHHHRHTNPERLIVHYMQPHYPFVPDSFGSEITLDTFGDMDKRNVWEKLRDGDAKKSAVWDGYRANLRYVLDNIEDLLDNIDGTVVISADHGNAIGEFGIYGHQNYVPVPAMRRVPWVETTATDERTRKPKSKSEIKEEFSRSERVPERDVEDRLGDLGYI